MTDGAQLSARLSLIDPTASAAAWPSHTLENGLRIAYQTREAEMKRAARAPPDAPIIVAVAPPRIVEKTTE